MSSPVITKLGPAERAAAALPEGRRADPDVQFLLGAPGTEALADAAVAYGHALSASVKARAARDALALKVGIRPQVIASPDRWPELDPTSRDALIVASLEANAAEKVTRDALGRVQRVMVALLEEPPIKRWLAEQCVEVADNYAEAVSAFMDAETQATRLGSLLLTAKEALGVGAKQRVLGLNQAESRRVPRENEAHLRKIASILREAPDE